MAVIALDLGGTKLASALFRHDGKILQRNVIPLNRRKGEEVSELITDDLRQLLVVARAKKLSVHGVGVSVPGISYQKLGKVWAPNIPGWSQAGGFPLRQKILSALRDKKVLVTIDSDRACYISGEAWRGCLSP